MHSRVRLTLGLILMLLVCALLPGLTAAQGGDQSNKSGRPREQQVNTVLMNVVSPTHIRVIGTLVTDRVGGVEANTTWTFRGTSDGLPENAGGRATESWSASNVVRIVNLGTHSVYRWNMLKTPSGQFRQVNARLLDLNLGWVHVPLAVNGLIHRADQAGQTFYVVTNAGSGSKTVQKLPGASLTPYLPDEKAPGQNVQPKDTGREPQIEPNSAPKPAPNTQPRDTDRQPQLEPAPVTRPQP